VDYTGAEPEQLFGDLTLVQSNQNTGRKFTHVSNLSAKLDGQEVWLRARVHNTRAKGNNCFVVLRAAGATVQGAMFKSETIPKEMIKFAGALSKETVVDVKGTIVKADVKSCTQNDVELSVLRLYVVSRAEPGLPLQIDDAGRSEAEIAESERKHAAGELDGAYVRVGTDIRLDNRVIDMRVPAQNAIFRISSVPPAFPQAPSHALPAPDLSRGAARRRGRRGRRGVTRGWRVQAVGHFFRTALMEKGFTEIHTPKIIAGASEGGADVFRLKYMEGSRFEQPGCLAQSPQLYKQMCIMGDLERVYEVGPVFRAENSHTGRHLTEFVGLDFEMCINESYTEALDVTDFFMVKIFEGIKKNFAHELKIISQQYPFEPLQYNASGPNFRMKYPEAMQLLRAAGLKNEDGSEISDFQDLSTPQERKLGEIVKAKHGTDFWCLEHFPMEVRPFYTMPCAHDARYSNSYDVFMRGQEIMSGAQRVHTVDILEKQCREKVQPPSREPDRDPSPSATPPSPSPVLTGHAASLLPY
jgi:aspartyl/asparaginyl-tRNA synthetase